MSVLRRYGRGLRLNGQALEVDFGTGADQAASGADAGGGGGLLLATRTIHNQTTFTTCGMNLWVPAERKAAGKQVQLRVIFHTSDAGFAATVRLRNLTTKTAVWLAGPEVTDVATSQVDPFVWVSGDLSDALGFDPAAEALYELQSLAGDPTAYALVEVAELIVTAAA